MSTPYPIRKVVVVGASKVGKSAAMEKAEGREYVEDYRQTIGVDFHSVFIHDGEGKRKIHIWDIGGSPQFRQIGLPYMKSASMIVLMYDISRSSTLDELSSWHRVWADLARGRPILVVGTCSDKQDRCYGAGRAYARSICAPHLSISAKTGEGMHELIQTIVAMCDQADEEAGREGRSDSLLGKKRSGASRFCCTIL